MTGSPRDLALELRDLRKRYAVRGGGSARALDGVSLSLHRGEALGVVGESGGGKTTLALAALRLVELDGGEIRLHPHGSPEAVPFHALGGEALRRARRSIQIVFQDPSGSLDPRQAVGRAVEEGLEAAGIAAGPARARAACAWLERVGLPPSVAARRPAALSGGERQRVAIARALAAGPEVLVLDEATASLDVSVRAGIVALLRDVRRDLAVSLLVVSHDADVVAALCDRVAVLYLGRIVEELPADRFARGDALHPYTRLLVGAEGLGVSGASAVGPVPADARAIPPGCRFHPGCPIAEPACVLRDPVLEDAGEDRPGMRVACPPALARIGGATRR